MVYQRWRQFQTLVGSPDDGLHDFQCYHNPPKPRFQASNAANLCRRRCKRYYRPFLSYRYPVHFPHNVYGLAKRCWCVWFCEDCIQILQERTILPRLLLHRSLGCRVFPRFLRNCWYFEDLPLLASEFDDQECKLECSSEIDDEADSVDLQLRCPYSHCWMSLVLRRGTKWKVEHQFVLLQCINDREYYGFHAWYMETVLANGIYRVLPFRYWRDLSEA